MEVREVDLSLRRLQLFGSGRHSAPNSNPVAKGRVLSGKGRGSLISIHLARNSARTNREAKTVALGQCRSHSCAIFFGSGAVVLHSFTSNSVTRETAMAWLAFTPRRRVARAPRIAPPAPSPPIGGETVTTDCSPSAEADDICKSLERAVLKFFAGPIENVDTFLFAEGDDSAVGDLQTACLPRPPTATDSQLTLFSAES